MTRAALTLYYDGKCPFCRTEMARLGRWDRAGRLAFVDMSVPGFDPSHLGVTMAQMDREMVSQRADGTILSGTESILAAYPLVGRGWVVWPLRVPVLRGLLSWLYRLFARNRYRMSRLLGYQGSPPCVDGVCANRNPYLNDRTDA
jgi:predicted DCC family thiol-disulfide oxidoreductase YuxK